MIRFLSDDEWNADWEAKQRGRLFIDLEDARDAEGILRRLGARLKGRDSPLIEGRSPDAFTDVLSDWMIEAADERIYVYVKGQRVADPLKRELRRVLPVYFDDARSSARQELGRTGASEAAASIENRIKVAICF